ncbi:ABC transporter permease [Neomoorella humiferrea]|uniref:ABC transporter permease n=1 Tax=Neomoorella humiferrea TaxID=676965 RepID=UPI003D941287
MVKFIAKRLAYCIVVLIGVSLITFLILHLSPGNPARLMLPEGATEEQVRAMSERLGLNKPLYEQYALYISGVLRGDLGTSLFYKQPNTKIILERLPATVQLTFAAVFLSLLISLPLGIIAGVKRGSTTDLFSMFLALLGQSMSPVWLGILLIYVLSVKFNLLPPFGYGKISHLIMPAITLGTPLAAIVTRLTRAGMVDVLGEDYILATRAKGLPESKVIYRYALKNVMIPVTTVVGIQIGTFLGGAVVTEQIFGWPGVGRLAVSAIMARDFPLVQAIMLVVSALFVLVNLLVDITYTLLDPRLKFD